MIDYDPFGEENWEVQDNKSGIEDHSEIDPFGEEIWEHRGPPIADDYTRNLLPVAMRIAAQTIGLDLVAVRPLGSPSLRSDWFDYKYGTEEIKPKGKQIFSEIDPFGEETWLD